MAYMFGNAWWKNRRARHAANSLQQATLLIEAAIDVCDHKQALKVGPANPVRRAKAKVACARRIIEEIQELSFNAQSRFFRLFECIEECLDYSAESIVYAEFDAAIIDLNRAIRGIDQAASLMHSQLGIHAARPLFPSVSRNLALRVGRDPHPLLIPHPEVIELYSDPPKEEPAEKRPSAMLL